MRILLITPWPLLPIERGLELRIYNLIEPLCSKHQISVISFTPEKGVSENTAKTLKASFSEIALVELDAAQPDNRGRCRKIHDVFSPPSVSMGRLSASANMENAFRRLLEDNDYDLILVAGALMVNYVLGVNHVPVVVDAVDDLSLLYRRQFRQAKGIWKKAVAFKEWLAMEQMQKKFFSQFKEIVITSPVDAKVMRSHCPDSIVTVIPNGVDSDYFAEISTLPEEPIIVFSGVMNYGPNVSAMTYFCRSIFPQIRAEIPEAKLLIVGRTPSDEVLEHGRSIPGVAVTGSVDDIRPYLARSRVYVSPLIVGAGFKNKILEAWAAGKPIVGTSLSCEGIDVAPGEDILVEDDSNSFARAVVNLLRDNDLAKRLAKNGRDKVVKQYGWEPMALKLERVFHRAVSNFGA